MAPEEAHPILTPTPHIPFLGGLRGVAILLVLGFHTYARWTSLMPWAAGWRDFPLFKFGHLGVELFFMISGFVILMTLERCGSFAAFIRRRWLRLFPAMLLVSLALFATAGLFPQRPLGPPSTLDLVPGLLFIEPFLLSKLTGLKLSVIEAGLWSLFVEVKFYLVFGALHFIRRERAVGALSALFLGAGLLQALAHGFPALALPGLDAFCFLTSVQYFGWFAVGALLCRFHATRGLRYLVGSLLMLPAAAAASRDLDSSAMLACGAIYGVFVAGLCWRRAAGWLSNPVLRFWGFVSYPLYLLHENAMVAMAIQLHGAFPEFPGLLTPLPGLALLLALAWLVARYGEGVVRAALVGALVRLKGPRLQA